MLKAVELVKNIIFEIENPISSTAFLININDFTFNDEKIKKILKACIEKKITLNHYNLIVNYIKSYDFTLAKCLIYFSLLVGIIFFLTNFTDSNSIINMLIGSLFFYFFIFFITTIKLKQYHNLKNLEIYNYRKLLIKLACLIIKSYSLNIDDFPIKLNDNFNTNNLLIFKNDKFYLDLNCLNEI